MAAAFRAAWDSLARLVADKHFVASHRLSGEYVVSLISPDDVANLILGDKVSCDGSPQGKHPEMMLERLAGGWVVWSIAKDPDKPDAVAWATLNRDQDLVIDSVDAGDDFPAPPLGDDLVEALLTFGPKVAAAIGARRVFVAAPKDGRYATLDTSKRDPQHFFSCVPPFMGGTPYTDSINRGAKNYFIIDPS